MILFSLGGLECVCLWLCAFIPKRICLVGCTIGESKTKQRCMIVVCLCVCLIGCVFFGSGCVLCLGFVWVCDLKCVCVIRWYFCVMLCVCACVCACVRVCFCLCVS